jgi:hypothetical protein
MGQNSSARTFVNLDPTAESASNIHLLDPDVADTKGHPRLLTIKERIKQNKFYSCSHCGSNKHTNKNCDKLHLVFNLPKKPRKQKKKNNGEIYFLTMHIAKIYKLLMTKISLMTGSK